MLSLFLSACIYGPVSLICTHIVYITLSTSHTGILHLTCHSLLKTKTHAPSPSLLPSTSHMHAYCDIDPSIHPDRTTYASPTLYILIAHTLSMYIYTSRTCMGLFAETHTHTYLSPSRNSVPSFNPRIHAPLIVLFLGVS